MGVVKLVREVELVVEVVVGVRAMALGVGGKLVLLGVDRFLVGVEVSLSETFIIFSDCCTIFTAGWYVSDARMYGEEGEGVFQTVKGVSVGLRVGGAIAKTEPRSRGASSSSIICSLQPSSSILCLLKPSSCTCIYSLWHCSSHCAMLCKTSKDQTGSVSFIICEIRQLE